VYIVYHSECQHSCNCLVTVKTGVGWFWVWKVKENASISNFRGGFRWKSEYPWCILEVKSKKCSVVLKNKNQKKNDGNSYSKPVFNHSTNCYFYIMIITQKRITVNTWNLHQIFTLVVIYIQLNFLNSNS